jgi:homoserine O-acetyltransferase/O-succinyltransferase
LSRVTIPALVLGIDSDLLYPISEQHALAVALPRSTFHTIHSMDGHDGFLLEQDQVASHISTFLAEHNK